MSSAFRHKTDFIGDYGLCRRHKTFTFLRCQILFPQMLSYYRFHLLRISFSQVELLILRDYSLRCIYRKTYLSLDTTKQKALFSSSLMRMRVGGADGGRPSVVTRKATSFPTSQEKLVSRACQETPPKGSLRYMEAWRGGGNTMATAPV